MSTLRAIEITEPVVDRLFASVDVREHSGDALVVRYPKQEHAMGATFIWAMFLGMGLAMIAVGVKVSEEIGICGPALYILPVGTLSAVTSARSLIKHVMAWVRSVRGAWWLRLSINGFQVNDRLRRPRRYLWRDIDSFELVEKLQHYEDGSSGVLQRVGFHYSSKHRRLLHRRSKPDGFVMGYWDRPPDEAVALMNEWLTRYKAV